MPNIFGFPAEISIKIPPTVTPITAKGIAIFVVTNSYILFNIVKKSSNLQEPVHPFASQVGLQGTIPSLAAKTKTGVINCKVKNNKASVIIIFFMYIPLVPSAGFEPADSWFEAKCDIQFHHEGLLMQGLKLFYTKNNKKATPTCNKKLLVSD